MGARDHLPTLVDADALLTDLWREFLAPPPRLTVTEWAEKHRILSGKDSSEPGPYRVARTPYAREPMDCLSATSSVSEVVLMWGAQTSKTTLMSNWIGYLADLNPGPVMIVQPTLDMAKRYSRQRLAPMIEESPRLRGKIKANRSRDEANTTLLKEFPGGFLAVAGANSAAGLRSMPVRDLATDEEDGYPLDVDGEGDPVLLAKARQTTFSRSKHLRTSTPTTEGVSRIEAAYLASDRCRFHVPCPHCGELQHLEWGADKEHGLRWRRGADDAPLPDTAHYVCAHCGDEIHERDKPRMLAAGRWVAEREADGRIRGFHLNSLYSPLGWLSWADLVREWASATTAMRAGDHSGMRVFVNTRLAQTWKEHGDRADQHALRRRAESYPLRTVPHSGVLVTAGADVQGDRIEVYAWAWGRGEESWLVDHVVFYGDPALPETEPHSPWAALTEWRRLPMSHDSGAKIGLTAMAVDSGGHQTEHVYRYARRWAHERVIAIKGSSTPGRAIIGKPTDVEFNHAGRRIKSGGQVWIVGSDTAKALFYSRLQVQTAGPGFVHTTQALPGYVWEQMTAERIATRYVKGHPKREWVLPPGRRNEALDCAAYAIAAAWHVGVPRHTEAHWARYEARLRQTAQLALPLDTESATMDAVARSEAPPADTAAGPQPETVGATTTSPAPVTAPRQAQPRRPTPPRRRGWVTKW